MLATENSPVSALMPTLTKAGIGGNVVNPVRHRLAEFGNDEVMHPDRRRLPFWPQLTAAIFEVADKLLLLRIDRDYRLPGRLECLHLGVDMLELSVAIRVIGAFARLAVGLQAEVEALQQAADQLLTGDETPLGQRRGEMALAQADPPQGGLGITADRRLHHFIQRVQDPWLRLGRSLLSAAPAANPFAAPHRPGAEIHQAAADGAAGNSGHPRNRSYSATAGSTGFTGSEQASVSLIEERSECIEAGLDAVLVDHSVRLNATSLDLPDFSGFDCCVLARRPDSFLAIRLFRLGPKPAEPEPIGLV